MKKKIIAMFQVGIMLLGTILAPINGVFAADSATQRGDESEAQVVYASDIFYGYPGGLKYYFMLPKSELSQTLSAVRSEYITTPEFTESVILSCVKDATNTKEIIKYFREQVRVAVFNQSECMDSANAKFIQALCGDEFVTLDDKGTMRKFLSKGQKISDGLKKLEKFRLDCESYIEDGKAAKTYDDFTEWTFAYLKEYCTYIDPKNFDTLRTRYYTYFSSVSGALKFSGDAMEFAEGLMTSIFLYDMQIELVQDIMDNQDTDSMLYKGMQRYKKQLEQGFLMNYAIDMITDEFISAMAKIADKVGAWIEGDSAVLAKIVRSGVAMCCDWVMFILEVKDYDYYVVATILEQYALDMYDYMNKKIEQFDGCFLSDSILAFEKEIIYCFTASKLALKTSKDFAKYNTTYNIAMVEESLKTFSDKPYEECIQWVKDNLSEEAKRLWKVEQEPDGIYELKDNNYEIVQPSNEIETGKIYLFEGQVFGELVLKNSKLEIPEGVTAIVHGDVSLDEKSSIINYGSLVINGNVTAKSRTWKTTTRQLHNYGDITISGKLDSYDTDILNMGKFIVTQDFTHVTHSGKDITSNGEMAIGGNLSLEGGSEGQVFSAEMMYLYQTGNKLTVLGNLILNNNAFIVCSKGVYMHVGGDTEIRPGYGLTADRGCGLIIESGELHCDGNIVENSKPDHPSNGILELGKGVTLYAKGNIEFYAVDSNKFEAGKVILNGTETQGIKTINIYDMEVTNPNGVELLDDICVRGTLNMNGNPMFGKGKLVLYEKAKLSSGTVYPIIQDKELRVLNYDLACRQLRFDLSNEEVIINEGVNIKVCDELYIPLNSKLNVVNYGKVEIEGNLMMDYMGHYTNHGVTMIAGNLAVNFADAKGFLYSGSTIFTNSNYVSIGNDLIVNNAAEVHLSDKNAVLHVGGDITRKSTAWTYEMTNGKLILDGAEQQTISGLSNFGIIEITNQSEAGVVFNDRINVSILFNHNRNNFTLANEGVDSTFVDYDGDEMLDHLDEYPTIKMSQLSVPTVDVEAGIYAENQTVILSSDESDVEIYYTLDGSVPDIDNGMKYTGAIDIMGSHGEAVTIVLKTVAVKGGMQNSMVAEYVYLITLPKIDGPEAPENLVGIATTDVGVMDGVIQGTNSKMEYSTNPEFTRATVCTGEEVTGLAAGTYYVRIAETDDTNAGAYTSVVVEEHKHTFAETWNRDRGMHWHVASCGHDEVKGSLSRHAYKDYVYNGDATYVSDGTETGTCVCGKTNTRVKLGSKLVDTTKPIVTIGINGKVLENVGGDITFEAIYDDEIDLAINAEDMESGVNFVEYYIANKILTEAQVESLMEWRKYEGISKLNLMPGQNIIYVKVTDVAGNNYYVAIKGYTLIKCDHKTTTTEIIKTTNCVEEGVQVKKCTICGEVVETQKIAALGHRYEKYEIVKDATDTENGEISRICGACGEVATTVIPKVSADDFELSDEKGHALKALYSVDEEVVFIASVYGKSLNPLVGDMCYVPVSWKLGDVETKYEEGEYAAEFTQDKAGDYDVEIIYERRFYTSAEAGWAADGKTFTYVFKITVEETKGVENNSEVSSEIKALNALPDLSIKGDTPPTGDSAGAVIAILTVMVLAAVGVMFISNRNYIVKIFGRR